MNPGIRIGLGLARLSFGPVDHAAFTSTVAAALDAGVRLFDTAPAYTPEPDQPGEAERLLASALRALAPGETDVVIATKCGSNRVAADEWRVDGSPAAIRRSCETSLRALGVEAVDLLQLHWPDPDVPLVESVEALAALRDEGKARRIGLSNVTVDQLDAAGGVTRIDCVQNKLGAHDSSGLGVVAWCEAAGTAFLAYEPLGGSLAPVLGDHVPALGEAASACGASAPQVALAWLLAQSACVTPLIGSTRPATLAEAVDACSLRLSPEQLAALDGALVGTTEDKEPTR